MQFKNKYALLTIETKSLSGSRYGVISKSFDNLNTFKK